MVMSSSHFNKTIPSEGTSKADGYSHFKNLLHASLEADGLSPVLSTTITSILVGLKENGHRLSDPEINMIIGSLQDNLVKPVELLQLIDNKEAFIQKVKEALGIKDDLFEKVQTYDIMSTEQFNRVNTTEKEDLRKTHELNDFKGELIGNIKYKAKIDATLSARIADILISLKTGLPEGAKITGEELGILVAGIKNYPVLAKKFEEYIQHGLNNKELFMAIVKCAPMPPFLEKLMQELKPDDVGYKLATNQLSDAICPPELNPLTYLIFLKFRENLRACATSLPPLLHFLESMRSLPAVDIKAIFNQKNSAGQDALEDLLQNNVQYALPLLTKMLEVLPGYAAVLTQRLTPANFPMKKLGLERHGAIVELVHLFLDLKIDPKFYKKADWGAFLKETRDPILMTNSLNEYLRHLSLYRDRFLLNYLDRNGVMSLDEYISFGGLKLRLLGWITTYQANELKKEGEKKDHLDDIELLSLFSGFFNSHNIHHPEYLKEVLLTKWETLQPIPASGTRVDRLFAYQDKYKEITNNTHFLYALYREEKAKGGENKAAIDFIKKYLVSLASGKESSFDDTMKLYLARGLELQKRDSKFTGTEHLVGLTSGKKPHPEASMALAMIARDENNQDEQKKWVDKINARANPTKRPSLFAATAKSDPICEVLISGGKLNAKQDVRSISKFIGEFEENIREIFPTAPKVVIRSANIDPDPNSDNSEEGPYNDL